MADGGTYSCDSERQECPCKICWKQHTVEGWPWVQNILFVIYVGLIWDMRHSLLKSVTIFETFLNDLYSWPAVRKNNVWHAEYSSSALPV